MVVRLLVAKELVEDFDTFSHIAQFHIEARILVVFVEFTHLSESGIFEFHIHLIHKFLQVILVVLQFF